MKKFLLILAFLLIPITSSYAIWNFGPFDYNSEEDEDAIPNGFPSGLTFYKTYQADPPDLNADFSLGVPTATFTATRSATAPATYIDANGIIQLVTSSNTPRFQQGYYDATGFHAQKGLMIEAAGTNLMEDSFTSLTLATYWIAVVGTGGTGAIADDTTYPNPYGAGKIIKFTGTKIDDRVTNASAKRFSTTSGTTYAFSIFLRGSGDVYLRFAPTGGTIQTSSKITLANTGWTKYSAAFVSDATNTTALAVVLKEDNAVTCYNTDWQCEAAPYATSFIPTTTAALTRGAEVLTYPISNNRTAEKETIFIKFALGSDFANDGTERDLTDTHTKQRFIRKRSATNTDRLSFQPNSTDSGSSVSYTTTVPLANTSYVVCGVAYGTTADTNSEIYLTGISERSETTNYTLNAWGTVFSLGSASGGSNQLNGIIQSVSIFNRDFTVSEVAAVSTIMANN